MTDNPAIATDLIQTVFFDMTNRQFVDLVNPFTKIGVYSHKTGHELALEYKAEIVQMDREQARRLQDDKHITPLSVTTEDYYHQMLEVLPPCQWHHTRDFGHFYLSERISGSIVLYLVHAGQHYVKFQDRAGLPSAVIRDRMDAFIAFGISQEEEVHA